MRYSHEKRLKTVELGPASSNALVRFLCGCLSRTSLFEVTDLVPEPCPTVPGDAANGGSVSAGSGEDDDDVVGAAAEPADAVPLFSGLEWSDRPPSGRSALGNPSIVLVAPSDAPSATIPTGSGGLANLLWVSTGRCGFLSLKASDENGVIVINLSS